MSGNIEGLMKVQRINAEARNLTGQAAHRYYADREKIRDYLRSNGFSYPGQLDMLVDATSATMAAEAHRRGTEPELDLGAALLEARSGPYGEVFQMGKDTADKSPVASERERLIAEGLKISNPAQRAEFARAHGLL